MQFSRQSWQKIQAVEMYISHLIIPLPDNDEVTKGAFRLWHVSGTTVYGKLHESVLCMYARLTKNDLLPYIRCCQERLLDSTPKM